VIRAELLEQAGDAEAAAEEYRLALAADASCAVAEVGLGRLLVEADDLEASRRHLERARQLQPEARPIHDLLADVYRRLGETEAAAEEARQAATLAADVWLHDAFLEQVLDEDVSSAGYLERASRAEREQEPEKAEEYYHRLTELHPDDPSMMYNMGNMLFRHGKVSAAEPYLRRALEMDPSHVSAHIVLGSALIALGREEEGLSHFKDPVPLGPEHGVALNNLGIGLVKEDRPDLAAFFFRKALELEPDNTDTRYNLARFLAGQREVDEAMEHYLAILEVRPDSGPAHRDLAYSLTLRGRYREAWEHVHAARAVGESFPADFLQTLSSNLPDPGP
jgi:tetratricopeptide (TPR) repeat protein